MSFNTSKDSSFHAFLALDPTLNFQYPKKRARRIVHKYNAPGRYEFLLVARHFIKAYLFGRRYSGYIPQERVDALRLHLIKDGIDIDAIERACLFRDLGFHTNIAEC